MSNIPPEHQGIIKKIDVDKKNGFVTIKVDELAITTLAGGVADRIQKMENIPTPGIGDDRALERCKRILNELGKCKDSLLPE
jgi:hypothetical protein